MKTLFTIIFVACCVGLSYRYCKPQPKRQTRAVPVVRTGPEPEPILVRHFTKPTGPQDNLIRRPKNMHTTYTPVPAGFYAPRPAPPSRKNHR